MVISMLKIRRLLGRLIFNMGIAIPGKTVFLIEMAPCIQSAANIFILTGQFHAYVKNDMRKYKYIFKKVSYRVH